MWVKVGVALLLNPIDKGNTASKVGEVGVVQQLHRLRKTLLESRFKKQRETIKKDCRDNTHLLHLQPCKPLEQAAFKGGGLSPTPT